MKEIWKDVPGYEGLYQVSNLGNVKRILFKNGLYEIKKEREKIKAIDKYGYYVVDLSKNGKQKKYLVHRLVAQAFISNTDNKPQVNHIDGNKQNNYVGNLEWCTNSENQLHAYRIKLKKKYFGKKHWNYNKIGKLHPQSKKIIQYNLNNDFIKEWGSIGEASKKTKINIANICYACKGKRKSAGNYIWKYKEE